MLREFFYEVTTTGDHVLLGIMVALVITLFIAVLSGDWRNQQ